MALKNLFKKDGISIKKAERENYIIDIKTTNIENLYHLLVENFWGDGFNYFKLFLDKDRNLIHIFDSLSNGTSMINRVDEYLLKELSRALDIEDYKNIRMAIYYPEPGRDFISITMYSLKDGNFSFGGKIDDKEIYSEFKNR